MIADYLNIRNKWLFLLWTAILVLLVYIQQEMFAVPQIINMPVVDESVKAMVLKQFMRWRWVGFVVIPVLVLLRVSLTAGCMFVGALFDERFSKLTYKGYYGVAMKADVVSVVNAVVSCVTMPLFFWVIYRHNAKIILQQKEVMMGYALTESNFISTINGIATIKNYNRQGVFQKINKLLYDLFQQKAFDLGGTEIRIGAISGIIGTLIMMVIVGFSSWQVFQEAMSIGEMMAVIGIAGTLFPSIANLALISIPINEAKVAFDRMFDVIGESKIPQQEQEQSSNIDTVEDLKITDLGFRFTGLKRLLTDINMEFHRGKVYCIVGESGSGKSTLFQIIQRFYEPETGSISVDGVDANDISIAAWNDLISVVPQDIFIYNGTVLENICFGQVPEDLTEVVDFCQKYGFDKFFEELPQGLLTIVGEEGINLSGGQKQLLALARALFKPFQILLLDETTSAMDRKTERTIGELLTQLKKERIIIFVTHRLETAKRVSDFIYVINDGNIQAKGPHDELMKTTNFYSEYWS